MRFPKTLTHYRTRHQMVTLKAIDTIRTQIILPPYPASTTRIRDVIDKPSFDSDDVAKILEEDPPLAAEVLRYANSVHYGLQDPVGSIHDAVVVVGAVSIYNLSLQAELMAFYSGVDLEKYMDCEALWKHAIVTAQICSQLAKLSGVGGDDGHEELYTCGLLHDLGMFSMAASFGEEYVEVTKYAEHDSAITAKKEQKQFGFSHTEVGAVIGHIFKLPGQLVDAIEKHHDPVVRLKDDRTQLIVAIADKLVHAAAGNMCVPAYVPAFLRHLNLGEDDAKHLWSVARERLADASLEGA